MNQLNFKLNPYIFILWTDNKYNLQWQQLFCVFATACLFVAMDVLVTWSECD